MTEQIDANLKINANFDKAIADGEKFHKTMSGAVSRTNEVSEAVKALGGLIKLANQSAQDFKATMGFLKRAELGTFSQQLNRSSQKAYTNAQAADPNRIAVTNLQRELSLRTQIYRQGEALTKQVRESVYGQTKSNDLLVIQKRIAESIEKIHKAQLTNTTQSKAEQEKELVNLQQLYRWEKQILDVQKAIAEARKKTNAEELKAAKDLETARKKAEVQAARPPKKEYSPLDRFKLHGGADILEIQTRLNLNQKLINSMANTVNFTETFIVQLDSAMFNLQAITQSTDAQMGKLKKTLESVAQGSKFSSVELANAAVTLGQAGFSTDQIKDSISAISQLATASGSDLPTAMEVTTTALNVFELQADQASVVANTLTAALNESKLGMGQLQLAIQYASNVASDANIPFAEMVASFGAAADAGIKSGSTIGTGYRQLLLDLQNPSDKLLKRLGQLGISLDRVSIPTYGLEGVLKNLAEAGFTSADALKTMELRGASMFSALSNNLDSAERMRKAIISTNAAAQAAAVQMGSLENIGKNTQSIYGTLASNAFEPLLVALKGVTQAVGYLGKELSKYPNTMKVLATSLTAIIGGGFLVWIAVLLKNMASVNMATGILIKTLAALTIGMGKAAVAALAFMATPVGLAITAIGAAAVYAAYKLDVFGDSSSKYKSKTEELSASVDESKNKVKEYGDKISGVSKFVEDMAAHSRVLRSDQGELNLVILDAKTKFDALSGSALNMGDSYTTVTEALRGYKAELLKGQNAELGFQAAKSEALTNSKISDVKNQVGPKGDGGAFGNTGFYSSVLVNQMDPNISKLIAEKLKEAFSSYDLKRANDKTEGQENKRIEANALNMTRMMEDFASKKDIAGVNDILTGLVAEKSYQEEKQKLLESSGKYSSKQNVLVQELQGYVGAFTELKASLEAIAAGGADATQAKSTITANEEYQKVVNKEGENISLGVTKIGMLIDTLVKYQGENKDPKTGQPLKTKIWASDNPEVNIPKTVGIMTTLVEKLNKDLERLNKGTPAEKKFASEQQNSPEYQNILQTLTNWTQGIDSQEKERSKSQIDLLKSQQEAIQQNVQKNGEDEKAKSEFITVTKQLMELEKANAQAESEKKIRESYAGSNYSKDFVNKKVAADNALIAKTYDQKLQNAITGLSGNVGKFDEEVLKPVSNSFTEFKLSVDKVKGDFEQMSREAEAKSKLTSITRKLEAADYIQNRGKVTQSEKDVLTREKEKLLTPNMQDQLGQRQKYGADIAGQIAKAKQLQEQYLAQYDAAMAEGRGATTSGGQANARRKANDVASQYQSVTTTLQELEQTQKQVNTEIDDFKQKITDADQKVGDLTIGETFRMWAYNQGELAKETASLSVQFDELLTGSFQAAQSSFSTMFKEVINGTKGMKSAFKDFAISVLSSMQDIAVNSLAKTLFGYLGSGLSAAFGSPTATGAPTPTMASGGLVTGGIPGKDSVPIIAMPGEYVLKRSAVQAMGVDTLHQINQGNAAAAASSNAVSSKAEQSRTVNKNTAVNVYVVSKDGVPSLGPNDIVAVISDSIARGGSLRQLIKSVVV